MHRILILITFTILSLSQNSISQINFWELNNPHTANLASSTLPSLVGDHTKVGEFYPFSIQAGFGNNFMDMHDINLLQNSGTLSNEYIDNYLNKTPSKNLFWAGTDIPFFNVFFNVKKKYRKPFLSFGIGARQKTDLSLNFSKELLALAYKGNKQFADQSISLAPSMNLLSYNELFVTASGIIPVIKSDSGLNITIKPAVRVRRLIGLAGVYMPNAALDMYTDPEGKYLDFDANMILHASGYADTPNVFSNSNMNLKPNADLLKGSGKGWGYDLGATATINNRVQLSLSLIDLGSIQFEKNVVNYSKFESFRYDGFHINSISNASDSGFTFSNIKQILQPDETHESFSMPLPTKLILHGNYGFFPKKRRRIPYYVHNVSATYVQGFKNYLSSTTIPMLNIGYTYSYKNIFNAGTGFTFGGLNKIMTSAQMTLKANFFKLGVGTNNILPLITARAGKGTDVHLFLGFSF